MPRSWIILAAGYVLLLGCGFVLGKYVSTVLELRGGDGSPYSLMTMAVASLYLVTSAIPFIPGAEIGFALMVVFGAKIALLVYACMVAALWAAFIAGLLLPKKTLRHIFRVLHLRRASAFVRLADTMSGPERQAFMMQNLPGRFAPFLMRHRYIAVALLFNLPGNVILGGGGGIALFAGMSRVYHPGWFFLASALGVAPVPILFVLFGVHA